jgi:DNA modification methylase
VSVAVTKKQTGITTITINLQTLDGSVESATFNITPKSWELGVLGSRFKYCSKANKSDRNEGLDDFEEDYNRGTGTHHNGTSNTRVGNQAERAAGITHVELQKVKNVHPTVKPTDLMRYLCRLVTQPGGTVLDPFMGSGTTGKAAMLDGFEFIGCEMDEQYYKIAEARIRHALER